MPPVLLTQLVFAATAPFVMSQINFGSAMTVNDTTMNGEPKHTFNASPDMYAPRPENHRLSYMA